MKNNVQEHIAPRPRIFLSRSTLTTMSHPMTHRPLTAGAVRDDGGATRYRPPSGRPPSVRPPSVRDHGGVTVVHPVPPVADDPIRIFWMNCRPFWIHNVIGSGGFGTVYKVELLVPAGLEVSRDSQVGGGGVEQVFV